MSQSLTKSVAINFKDGSERTIEHTNAVGTPANYIIFELLNGGSVHVNLDTVQTMDFSGLPRVRNAIITTQ